jgi:hypothetical protein
MIFVLQLNDSRPRIYCILQYGVKRKRNGSQRLKAVSESFERLGKYGRQPRATMPNSLLVVRGGQKYRAVASLICVILVLGVFFYPCRRTNMI